MAQSVSKVSPPKGWLRLVWRTPLWLHRLGLGWLLGGRFMFVNHVGRKSGRTRQALVEVIKYDKKTGTRYAASGYGPDSDWHQNVLAHPEVTIHVGGKTKRVRAVPLAPEACGELMVDYARRHPLAAKGFMWLIGQKVSGDDGYFAVGRDLVPCVAFEPRDRS